MLRAMVHELGVRERVLTTASKLFYAHGLRAVGINQIIAESKVAKASFYDHFPSKDDLVVAFLEARDAQWRQWLEDTVLRLSPKPAGRPLAVFDALVERFARRDFRGCAFINSMVELADREHVAHVAAEQHKRKVIAYLVGLLTAAGYRDVESTATDLMLLMDGATVTAVREGRPDSAQRAKRLARMRLAMSQAG